MARSAISVHSNLVHLEEIEISFTLHTTTNTHVCPSREKQQTSSSASASVYPYSRISEYRRLYSLSRYFERSLLLKLSNVPLPALTHRQNPSSNTVQILNRRCDFSAYKVRKIVATQIAERAIRLCRIWCRYSLRRTYCSLASRPSKASRSSESITNHTTTLRHRNSL